MTDSLFERTPADRLAALRKFAEEELKARRHMLDRHPERADYWNGRVNQAEAVVSDIAVLEHVIPC